MSGVTPLPTHQRVCLDESRVLSSNSLPETFRRFPPHLSCLASRNRFWQIWYEPAALPIVAVVGTACVGAAWYLTRLARGPDVIWDRRELFFFHVLAHTTRRNSSLTPRLVFVSLPHRRKPRGELVDRLLKTDSPEQGADGSTRFLPTVQPWNNVQPGTNTKMHAINKEFFTKEYSRDKF